MTDRPGDDAALEAEPIEVEAVADDPPAGEPAAGPEVKAAARRRRRGRLFLLLWLLPVVIVAALGYLVAGQPERLALFLAGKPPDMATTADIQHLTDRLLKAEVESADRAQVTAHSAAITDNREAIARVAAEAAALRDALVAFEQRFDARLEGLEGRLRGLEQAEPAVDPAVAAEIAGLREGLAALEARPMEEGAAGPVADPALASLKLSVAALEARLEGFEADGLEAQVAATDRAAAEAGAAADKALAELAALRDAVGNLARTDEAGAAVKLGVARLRFAVDSGAPFEEELEALQAAGGPGFGAWVARAGQGLPTAESLVRQFRQLARARTVRPEGVTGTPWLDDAIGRLSDVVSVRRVAKDLPGDDTDAALGRAEAHIEEGDLAGAVAELGGGLPPPFDGWRLVARDRLAADAELEALTARDDR